MRYPIMIIVVIAAAYGLLCLLAYIFQPRLVFFPDRRMGPTPVQLGVTYKDVFFETADGVRLNGWFIPVERASGVLLFCHGNAGNISDRLESIRIFLDLGLSVFIFDYRGYGRSDGKISEAGTYADARAAFDYLVGEAHVPPEQIIIFGRSLGAAVAIHLAFRQRPRALVVESAFTSIADIGQRAYPFLPVKWLSRIRYDSTRWVPTMDVPKLFIHSPADDVVPFDLGERLFAAAAEPKTFLSIGGDHNAGFIDSGNLYMDGWRSFLDAVE